MGNPLDQLSSAAKGAVQSVVNWSFNTSRYQTTQKDKTDAIFDNVPLDTLRRAAYHSVFSTLFLAKDEYPFVIPDDSVEAVVKKLAHWMFPQGTQFKIEDEKINELLHEILLQTKFQLKTEDIVTESALMGYCGLRSVYIDEFDRWLLEVIEKEYLVIETAPDMPDEYIAIGKEWPVERPQQALMGGRTVMKRYWKKERWTKDKYQVWPEQPENLNGKPIFKAEDATEENNNYGEIPITIVPLFYKAKCHGVGVVNEKAILTAKALIRLRHKRHFGHLKYMDPNPVRKNHNSPGEPLNLGIGNVLDITQADPNLPADLSLLEYAGMPDSVKDEIYDHIKSLFGGAGLKAPPKEEVMKPGTDMAGIALRLIDKDDAKTIETIRDNGMSMVLRHFEKVLRMGLMLNHPEHKGINLKDEASYKITANFPDFFPPTDQDISVKLSNMSQAELPPDIKAPMIAELFGLEDEKQIKAIETAQQEKADMLRETTLHQGF